MPRLKDSKSAFKACFEIIVNGLKYGKIGDINIKLGETFPSIIVMSEMIGVHRLTLREVYMVLEWDGIIIMQHGSRTIYNRAPEKIFLNKCRMRGFSV